MNTNIEKKLKKVGLVWILLAIPTYGVLPFFMSKTDIAGMVWIPLFFIILPIISVVFVLLAIRACIQDRNICKNPYIILTALLAVASCALLYWDPAWIRYLLGKY